MRIRRRKEAHRCKTDAGGGGHGKRNLHVNVQEFKISSKVEGTSNDVEGSHNDITTSHRAHKGVR